MPITSGHFHVVSNLSIGPAADLDRFAGPAVRQTIGDFNARADAHAAALAAFLEEIQRLEAGTADPANAVRYSRELSERRLGLYAEGVLLLAERNGLLDQLRAEHAAWQRGQRAEYDAAKKAALEKATEIFPVPEGLLRDQAVEAFMRRSCKAAPYWKPSCLELHALDASTALTAATALLARTVLQHASCD
jgi:hypothetical protein